MNFETKHSHFAILSDTHNDIINIHLAVNYCKDNAIDTIIHCGDLTSPDTVSLFKGFQIIHVIGNGDLETKKIQSCLSNLGTRFYTESVFEGIINGLPVAVTHGHIPKTFNQLITTSPAQYIFHGHTHQKRNTIINGKQIINPGSIGGTYRGDSRSFGIFNIQTYKLEFIELDALL